MPLRKNMSIPTCLGAPCDQSSDSTCAQACANITGCVLNEQAKDAEKCLCDAGYGVKNNQCEACGEGKYSSGASLFGCNPCPSNSVGIKGTGPDGNIGNIGCQCLAGYGATRLGSDGVVLQCDVCTNKYYMPTQTNKECLKCGDNQVGAPADGNASNSAKGPNTLCLCTNASEAVFNQKCIECSGEGQVVAGGACSCAPGYLQDGDSGACVRPSSASPLGALAISVLRIALFASLVVTAAIAITRRKAATWRDTDAAVVSEAPEAGVL